MKLDDAPWKNDYGPEPEMRTMMTPRAGRDRDGSPVAETRHQQMMKGLEMLGASVDALTHKLDPVLAPERTSPSAAGNDPSKPSDERSKVDLWHSTYVNGLAALSEQLRVLAERVDL